MFSRIWTKPSTKSSSEPIERLKAALRDCDAVVVGAGAGLSTAAGFTYSGERFEGSLSSRNGTESKGMCRRDTELCGGDKFLLEC